MAYEIFFDGFETYSTAADMLKFGYTSSPYSIENSNGRRSSKNCLCDSATGAVKSITASSHVVFGFAVKISAAAKSMTIELRNSSTVHASLYIPVLDYPTLTTAGVSRGAASKIYPFDTYMFVEFGISVGTPGTYEVKINGSSTGWFPLTTANTKNGSTTTIDNFRFYGGSGNSLTRVDDLYCAYGDELYYLGDSRVDRLLLTANSTPQEWTAPVGSNAYSILNTGSSYVSSNVDEATSYFTVADLDFDPTVIHGVAVRSLVKKSDAGYRESSLLLKSDSTEVESTPLPLSTDLLSQEMFFQTDPSTNTAWTTSGVNGIEVGMRVKA